MILFPPTSRKGKLASKLGVDAIESREAPVSAVGVDGTMVVARVGLIVAQSSRTGATDKYKISR